MTEPLSPDATGLVGSAAEAATLEEIDVTAVLGSCLSVWEMTIEAFIKFQLKRKPFGNSGTANLEKSILKLLSANSIAQSHATLDSLVAYSVRYGNQHIAAQFNDFPEEAREVVTADLLKSFLLISEQYLAPPAAVSPPDSVDTASATGATSASTDTAAVVTSVASSTGQPSQSEVNVTEHKKNGDGSGSITVIL